MSSDLLESDRLPTKIEPMSVPPAGLISCCPAKRTLEDHQTRLEPRIGLLNLCNLGFQSLSNALGNGRAIDLCGRHNGRCAGE